MQRLSNLSQYIFICLLVATISSCGFQLRGTQTENAQQLPQALQTIYLSGNDQFGSFLKTLRKAFELQGTHIENQSSNTPYQLDIIDERYTRRTISVTSGAKVAEYELRVEIEYALKDQTGRTLIGPDRIFSEKVYLFNKNLVLGKSEEETMIQHEMQQELANRLINRLKIQINVIDRAESNSASEASNVRSKCC